MGMFALDRILSIADDTNADMLYADHYRTAGGERRKHPVIDCQKGALRDDFDFGSVIVFRTSSFRRAVRSMTEEYQWGALYDLRLRMKNIVHINEYLYTEIETDLRKSGEKQFDYVNPAQRNVQVEMEQRRSKGRRHDCSSPFSGKIFCGDCGGVYGSKIWHSNSKYRRVIWQCNRKFKNETKCTTPHVDEEILKERFLQAVSEYMADPEERIEGLRSVHRTLSCTDFIDADIEEAEANLELLSGMIRNCVMMNASASLTEQEYQAQYTELSQRYESTKAGYEALLDRRKQMEATAITFSGILFRLAELPQIPMEFNETLWHTLVDHVTVYNDERIVFTFTDGTEIVTML